MISCAKIPNVTIFCTWNSIHLHGLSFHTAGMLNLFPPFVTEGDTALACVSFNTAPSGEIIIQVSTRDLPFGGATSKMLTVYEENW